MEKTLYGCQKCGAYNSLLTAQEADVKLMDRIRDLKAQLKYHEDLNVKFLGEISQHKVRANKLEAFLDRIKEVAFVAAELEKMPNFGIPEIPPAMVPLGHSAVTPPPAYVMPEKPKE